MTLVKFYFYFGIDVERYYLVNQWCNVKLGLTLVAYNWSGLDIPGQTIHRPNKWDKDRLETYTDCTKQILTIKGVFSRETTSIDDHHFN